MKSAVRERDSAAAGEGGWLDWPLPRPYPATFSEMEPVMSKWSFPTGDLMKGKRGVVMGVANDSSIAWGIAQQLAAQGAEIDDFRRRDR